MEETYNIVLNTAQQGIPVKIAAVQGDTGRSVFARVVGAKITEDTTARVFATKPSGLETYNTAVSVDAEENGVRFALTRQTLAEHGITKLQLSIYDGAGIRISTFMLYVEVERSLQDSGAIMSSHEYTILDDLIARADVAIPDAEDAAKEANEAAGSATDAAREAEQATDNADAAAHRANTAADNANTATQAVTQATELLKDTGLTVTVDELNYVSGVTGNVQEQLDEKLSLSGGTLTGNVIANRNIVAGSTNSNLGDVNSPFLHIRGRYYRLLDSNSKITGQFDASTAGTESILGESGLAVGNNIPEGTTGNARGRITLYGKNSGKVQLMASTNMDDGTYTLGFPGKNGTLALKENTVETTTGELTYYVNGSTGSDSNNGSESKPFKTIQHAIDVLPTFLSHSITIKLSAETYNENIVIDNIHGATLTIEGSGTKAESLNYNVSSVKVTNASNVVAIRGVQIKGTLTMNDISYGIYVSTSSGKVTIINSVISNSGDIGICANYFATVSAVELSIYSQKIAALSAINRGTLYAENIIGSDNEVVLQAKDLGSVVTNISDFTSVGKNGVQKASGGYIIGANGTLL